VLSKAVPIINAVTGVIVPKLDENRGWLFMFDLFSRIIFVLVTVFVGFVSVEGRQLLQSIKEHEIRLTIIESRKYTTADALRDLRQTSAELQSVKAWVETSYPPKYLLDNVNEIKLDLKEIQRMVQTNSVSIQSMIAQHQRDMP